MKKLVLMMTAALIGTSTLAQEDKAKTILDKVSKATKAYKTMVADFEQTIVNKAQGINQKNSGTLKVKGDKYNVDLGDTKIFSDGIHVWTYTKGDNTCLKEKISVLKAEGDYMDLGKLMTIWEEGYKRKYVGEETYNGSKVHVINLYPKNPKEADFHTLTLKIDASKNRLVYMEMKGRDGTVMTFKITKFENDKPLNDSIFKFDKSKFPGCEIIADE